MKTQRFFLFTAIVLLALIALPAPRAFAAPRATITVTNANDSGAGSLRQAIADAASGDTINFGGDYTINLTTAELVINKNLAIDGAGRTIVINGPGASCVTCFRVFNIASGIVTLNQLTISNGRISGTVYGGGVINSGTLTITNSVISSNSVGGNGGGGGIENDGTLIITNSQISNNAVASGQGGGIRNSSSGNLTIQYTTVSTNTSTTSSGGGIVNQAGILTMTNSTLSGNSAGNNGGGMRSAGNSRVTNVTINNNSATLGGGFSNTGVLTLTNTIVANNTGQDTYCAVAVTDGGNNHVMTNTGSLPCSFPALGDPQLGPLQNNGGTTLTHALKNNSPAIDMGNPTTCANSPVSGIDQRGQNRDDLACDIGAYEFKTSDGNAVTLAPSSSLLRTYGPARAGMQYTGTDPGSTTIMKKTIWSGGTPATALGAWWEITPVTGTGLNLTLSLCYSASELGGLTESNLRFWRYSGGTWNQVGGAPTLSGASPNRCAQISGVTDLSRWTLATSNPGNAPSAVTLSSFNAKPGFDLVTWFKQFLGLGK